MLWENISAGLTPRGLLFLNKSSLATKHACRFDTSGNACNARVAKVNIEILASSVDLFWIIAKTPTPFKLLYFALYRENVTVDGS